MRKRVTMIGVLIMAVWLTAGSLASALTIENKTSEVRRVYVYRHDDPLRWISCWKAELQPGDRVTMPKDACYYSMIDVEVWKQYWNPTRRDPLEWILDANNQWDDIGKDEYLVIN